MNNINIFDSKQGPKGTYFSMGGCQGCHGVAQVQNGFDFSFLFFGRMGTGFLADTLGVKSEEETMQRMIAKELMAPTP